MAAGGVVEGDGDGAGGVDVGDISGVFVAVGWGVDVGEAVGAGVGVAA